MDKFEKEELTKKRTLTKNTWYDWYDWLINYNPEPIRKSVSGVKDQIMSLVKTNAYSKLQSVKTVYGGGKKQSEENIIKSIRNLFKLKAEKERIKDRMIRDIMTLFKEYDYYQPTRAVNLWNNNFWNSSYIEYENSGNRNKILSLKEYLHKIKPYLRDIIINPQKSDAWKIQLAISINFISSKDDNEEHVMHSKSNNVEFMSFDNAINSHFFQDAKMV